MSEKIKIGFNQQEADKFAKNIKDKINHFQKLADYLEQFNNSAQIDREALYKDPFTYGVELTADNYKAAYKGAIIDKVFNLIGFSASEYMAISNSFEKIEIEFNPITLEYDTPDHSYYAETPEQIERWNAVKDVCKSIEVLRRHTPLHNGSLIQSLRGTLMPDYVNSTVQPNLNFILQGASVR